MIPYNFQYYCPASIDEAVSAFQDLDQNNLSPIYYGGGTEIVTQARKRTLSTGAVIDIKRIPDCMEHQEKDGQLIFGSALSLTDIIEKNLFPFFSKVCRTIADHTVRNQLTMGGNICGRLPYREVILPLLIVDAKVVLSGPEGTRELPITKAFDKKMQLNKGEFLVQVKVPKEAISLPHFNRRREKHTTVDYPLVHIAAVKKDDRIQLSFSGVSALPFRSLEVEDVLNNKDLSIEDRIKDILASLPLPIKKDQWASAEYRQALLEKSLFEMMADLEGVSL